MGNVPDSTAVERPRRNTRRPGWLTTDMVVAYALQESTSVRIIPRVTQGSDQAVVEDAEDVEEGQE